MRLQVCRVGGLVGRAVRLLPCWLARDSKVELGAARALVGEPMYVCMYICMYDIYNIIYNII